MKLGKNQKFLILFLVLLLNYGIANAGEENFEKQNEKEIIFNKHEESKKEFSLFYKEMNVLNFMYGDKKMTFKSIMSLKEKESELIGNKDEISIIKLKIIRESKKKLLFIHKYNEEIIQGKGNFLEKRFEFKEILNKSNFYNDLLLLKKLYKI